MDSKIRIIIFVVAVSIGICIWAFRSRIVDTPSGSIKPTRPGRASGLPMSFGYNCAWLAIRDVDPQRVIDGLDLQVTRRIGWSQGIELAYGSQIFVSPSMGGWVLVVGASLPDAGDESHADQMSAFVVKLSRNLSTMVQYFGSNRVVEYQAWAWADQGEMVRAYVYLGEQGATLLNVGDQTPGEIELNLNFFDEKSPEAKNDSYWERTDLRYPNEETVMAVAGKWSINPQTLDDKTEDVGEGWIGRLPGGS